MNLNEAAEIWKGDKFAGLVEASLARSMLVNTMLSELDPTPITEEWLTANGWVKQGADYIKNDNILRLFKDFGTLSTIDGGWRFKTLGELRTLLRLCGAQGETK